MKVETQKNPNYLTVGWREWVSLPEMKIPFIKAKIDTGARTSSLHTAEHEVFQKGGQDWVRFTVHPLKKNSEVETHTEASVSDYRVVRDSGGHEERRPFIKSLLKIGNETWEIEMSLCNRENMKFRMLLGRTALKGRVLVDCSQSYLINNKPKF